MLELIVAALALAAASAAVMALRHNEPPPALPPARRPAQGDLRPGDLITHLDQDYSVEGVMTCYDGDRPFVVVASLGVVGPYLLIEPGDQPRCALTRPAPTDPLDGTVPRAVVLDQRELILRRRAAVQTSTQGSHPCVEVPSCEAGIYRGPGETTALALVGAGEQLLLQGHAISPGSVTWLAHLAEGNPTHDGETKPKLPSAPPKTE